MNWIIRALTAFGTISPALTRERFPVLTSQQMTPEQKKVADKIMGSRKGLGGPFNPWLRSPELADRLQNVGEYVRYKSAISKPLSEFAILITARNWTSQVEWQIHYPKAIAAGIKQQVLGDLAAKKRPRGMNADETLVYDFSTAMHRDKGRVSDSLFDAVKKRFGEKGLIDLIGINGYYGAVAMTINAAEAPLANPGPPPLK